MKKSIVFFILSFFAVFANAQTATVASITQPAGNLATQSASVITADALTLKETDFDFGKIPQGKPVIHIFEVTNNSKDSLHINHVQASCGCTTPEWDRDKVQVPGETTKITVGYNAAAEGPFNKTITITYNGSLTKQIFIKGEVWKTPLTSAPENASLETLKN